MIRTTVRADDDLPLTVPQLLRERSQSRGDHHLLVCDQDVLTYSDARSRSTALAKGLMAIGAGPGSHVGLLYPNGVGFLVGWLAAARLGAVSVPVSTFSTGAEVKMILRNADVDILLSAGGYRAHDYRSTLREAVPELDLASRPPLLAPSVPALRRIVFEDGPDGWSIADLLDAGKEVGDEELRSIEDSVSPADRLVIVHTSGSTSDPKGVIHQHGPLIRHQNNLNDLRDYDPADVLFCNSPFFWIGGIGYAVLATLVAGGTLVCSNAVDPSSVLDLLERTRPTMVNGFAASVAHLAKDPSFAERDLSSITTGNLYPIMPAPVAPADPELRHNMLGTTETGSVCLASPDTSDQPEERRGSFGRPVPGFEAKVVDGELWLRGPFLMEGYYGREREDTFQPGGWYRTGDLFRIDDDGYFYFNGRASDMIKTAGANVSPREVEAAILDETGLVAHVVGIDDAERGQIVAAAVRVRPGHPVPDPEELRSRLRRRLSAYKVPKVMVMIPDETVPMMSSGKLDIRALKAQLRGE